MAIVDLYMQSNKFYPPSNHLHEMQVLLFFKNIYPSHFLSIHSPAFKMQSCMIYRLVTLYFEIATQLVFAGRRTGKHYHCTFVCMSIIKQYNAMTSLKGFIQTMQFVEKQHKLTLKAPVLCSNECPRRENGNIVKIPSLMILNVFFLSESQRKFKSNL